MIPGTVVDIGGTDYIVPPFRVGELEAVAASAQELQRRAQGGDAISETEVWRTQWPAILSAILRNHPDADGAALFSAMDRPTWNDLRAAVNRSDRPPANPPKAPAIPSTGAA